MQRQNEDAKDGNTEYDTLGDTKDERISQMRMQRIRKMERQKSIPMMRRQMKKSKEYRSCKTQRMQRM